MTKHRPQILDRLKELISIKGSLLFAILMSCVFLVNIIFYDNWLEKPVVSMGYSVLILALSLLLFILLYYLRNSLRILEKPMAFFCLYLILALSAIFLFYHPLTWDVGATIDSLKIYKSSQVFPPYLITYAYHLPFYFTIWLFDKLVSVNSTHFTLSLDLFNALIVTSSITIIGARLKQVSASWAKNFYIFSILFIPLILYITIPYTDTFSIFFLSLFIYFFTASPKGKEGIINFILAMVFIAIGAIIKQSLLIVIVASIIVIITQSSPKRSLNIAMLSIAPIALFLLFSWSFNQFFTYGYMKGDRQIIKNESFPIEHFFSMGQNDKYFGIYLEEDVVSVSKLIKENDGHPEAVKRILIDGTKQRITERGFMGNIRFFTYKFSKIWGQPDFFVFLEGSDCRFGGVMSGFQCGDSRLYKLFLSLADVIYTLIISIALLGSLYISRSREEPTLILLSKLSLIGIAAFLIAWETRSQYLLNFTPFLLITAAYYFSNIESYLPKSLGYNKKLKPQHHKQIP